MSKYFSRADYEFSQRASIVAQRELYPRVIIDPTFAFSSGGSGDTPSYADKFQGVDLYATDSRGNRFSISERFRRAKFAKYRELTFTLGSNVHEMPNDLAKCEADLMAYGYLSDDETTLLEALVVRTEDVKALWQDGKLEHLVQTNHRKQMTFAAIPFAVLDGISLTHIRNGSPVVPA